jgi:hypothetical protein
MQSSTCLLFEEAGGIGKEDHLPRPDLGKKHQTLSKK